jgi:hypothetical protein
MSVIAIFLGYRKKRMPKKSLLLGFGVYKFRLNDCWIDGVRSGMVNYRYGALWRGKSCSQSASSKLVVKLRGCNYVMLACPGYHEQNKRVFESRQSIAKTKTMMTLHSLF